jgi:hypothetical protein
MEIRPGLLGWLVLDLSYIAAQYRSYGYVTDSILIVTFAQSLYALDAMFMEPAILTTIDITTDGFGVMLAFGDLVWVPFTYSLQARYHGSPTTTSAPGSPGLQMAEAAYQLLSKTLKEGRAMCPRGSPPDMREQ